MERTRGIDYVEFYILSGIFNIRAIVNLNKENKGTDNAYGYYDDDKLAIVINLFFIKKENNPKLDIRRTIIHEMSHLLDFNCWQSWAYKQKESHEHYAVFTELFHDVIEGVANKLQPKIEVFLEEEEKEVEENE